MSVDFVYWQLVGSLSELIYEFMASNSIAQEQYKNRIQQVDIDKLDIISTMHQLIVFTIISSQLYYYKYTLSDVQNLSYITIGISLVWLFLTAAVYGASHSYIDPNQHYGYATLINIDFINCFWLLSNFTTIFSLIPQLAVSFKLFYGKLNLKFIYFWLLATVFSILTTLKPEQAFNLLINIFKTIIPFALIYHNRIYKSTKLSETSSSSQQLDIISLS